MTHADLHHMERKRARAVRAAGRMEQGDESVPVITLHPDIGDIAERVDGGRRLAMIECQQPTATADYLTRKAMAKREQEPLPADTLRRVATDAASARDELVGSRRYLAIDGDRVGAAELRAEIDNAIAGIDRLAELLAERYGS